MISREDLDFLIELQKELKTQETDCQAAPRFWGVIEDHKIYGMEGGYDDESVLIIDSEDFYDLQTAKEYLDGYEYPEEELAACTTLEELCEYIEEKGDLEAHMIGIKKLEKLSNQTGCFITKSACKRHIQLNDYHYRNPRTYAMTAWRNPEFERVMKILTETDWSKLPVEEK